MISIREVHSHQSEHYSLDQFDFAQWLHDILNITDETASNKLKSVWDFCFESTAGEKEQISCAQKAIEMVEILAPLDVDINGLCAALFVPFLSAKLITRDEISEHFDRYILQLVLSIERMKNIRQLRAIKNGDATAEQIDSIRRMLLAMVNDVRSVIIKLAERIIYLRDLAHESSDKQILAAKECFNIYAPLASRLGVGELKWEIEDLCFRYLHPDKYHLIATTLNEKRIDRENYVLSVVTNIQSAINLQGIKATVYGRPKHIYSIWRKMEKKNLSFNQLFDIRALRVICERVEDCYGALSVVHSLYSHIANEFDDYIAHPKKNGYQSIHTVVYGPQEKTIEIQIRTEQMHDDAELGIAAHWKYKEGTTGKMSAYDERIALLRELLTWQQDVSQHGDHQSQTSNAIFNDRIYVFTPKGDVIDLPVRSTPLDFAYHIHSDIGHRCIGAKISDRIVPFTYQLQTGDVIDIITQKNPNPNRDWLNPNNGFIHSNRSRAKIMSWLKKQDRDKNIAAGKSILDEMLIKHHLQNKEIEQSLIERYNAHTFDEILAGIGNGDIRINQLINYLNNLFNKPTPEQEDEAALKQISQKQNHHFQNKQTNNKAGQIFIEGIGNLMISIAKCCRPIPGDKIIGFITIGRGVSVHRQDCDQLIELKNHAPERIVDADWNLDKESIYSTVIRVIANDRRGLLRDITTLLANERVNVLGVASRSDAKTHTATIDLDVQIINQELLSRVLSKLTQLKDVESAGRV